MARAIADAVPSIIPRDGRSIAMAMSAPDEGEAGEPEVSAQPPLDRSTFVYVEARKGIDGEQYFGNCGSCENFVPEAYGRGAFRGARCQLFGSNFPISDDDGCDRWAPWPDGVPCQHCVGHAAEKVVAGSRGSVSPWSVGYAADERRVCSTCRQYDSAESECEFFACLNAALPNIFALDTKIVTPAKCAAWSAIPEPDDNG